MLIGIIIIEQVASNKSILLLKIRMLDTQTLQLCTKIINQKVLTKVFLSGKLGKFRNQVV
jgi:hypothetical protein